MARRKVIKSVCRLIASNRLTVSHAPTRFLSCFSAASLLLSPDGSTSRHFFSNQGGGAACRRPVSATCHDRHTAVGQTNVARSRDARTDFAERYAQEIDLAVAERMRELGIHDDQIGMPDGIAGIDWAAFHPHGTEGGNNSPDGRLIVDSGVLNLDLLTKDYGREAAALFEKSRLRDRVDAIIAHEYEEHRHGMDHELALKHAPDTALPISERAREICRTMATGWRPA